MPTYSYGRDRTRFDLLCHGMGQDGMQAKPQRLVLRISLDLDSKKFCIEGSCDQLTSVTKDKLQYQCDAEARGLFCESKMIRSTAGPFISHESFSFDRSSGQFSRKSSGSIGDIISRPYQTDFSGTCTLAPFTTLSPGLPPSDLDALRAIIMPHATK